MSVERAKELAKSVASNPEFKSKLESSKDVESRRKVIEEAGFGDVTKEDIQQLRGDAPDAGQVSDEQLDAVAGGSTGTWIYVTLQTLAAFG